MLGLDDRFRTSATQWSWPVTRARPRRPLPTPNDFDSASPSSTASKRCALFFAHVLTRTRFPWKHQNGALSERKTALASACLPPPLCLRLIDVYFCGGLLWHYVRRLIHLWVAGGSGGGHGGRTALAAVGAQPDDGRRRGHAHADGQREAADQRGRRRGRPHRHHGRRHVRRRALVRGRCRSAQGPRRLQDLRPGHARPPLVRRPSPHRGLAHRRGAISRHIFSFNDIRCHSSIKFYWNMLDECWNGGGHSIEQL